MKDNSIIIDAANDEIIFNNKSKFCYAEYIELNLPSDLHNEKHPIAVEPRPDHTNIEWPSPRFLLPVDGKVRILNETQEAHRIPKKHHLCQAVPSVRISKAAKPPIPESPTKKATAPSTNNSSPYSQPIAVNKARLGPNIAAQFEKLHTDYDGVFSPHFSGYNGSAGQIEGIVNMGPVLPPQRKGRVP